MSRGERAGLCLALALAPEPELLLLDDPAIGLDLVARQSLMESLVYATRAVCCATRAAPGSSFSESGATS